MTIHIYYNGITISGGGTGTLHDLVFTDKQVEEALLEIYHRCFKWEVGDKITLKRRLDE
jgi:hypothetical protein